MASPLRYTLVSDGPSDRALLSIIDWALRSMQEIVHREISRQWADVREVEREPGLAGKITAALHYYPCDLLFVHRDAESSEKAVFRQRREEIQRAMAAHPIPYVCVVPVRMTEAWLLMDADAIRQAADNPSSKEQINLPPLRRLEAISDPKQDLYELLVLASELTGRRRNKFRGELSWRRVRVAELIGDYSPLERLSAFATFLEDTREAVAQVPEVED
jgi:hypothetical protein